MEPYKCRGFVDLFYCMRCLDVNVYLILFSQRYTYQDFLPARCMKKMRKTRRVVVAAFDKFYNAESPFSDGKLKLKYLEIAEKSQLLECHRYQAEMVIVFVCMYVKFSH